MKIRDKAIAIFTLLILLLITGGYLITKPFFFNAIYAQEAEKARVAKERTLYLLQESGANLETLVGDWAPWDDTLYFINNHNEDYITDNLNDATLANLQINAAVFLDKQRQIVFSIGNDSETDLNTAVSDNLLKYIQSHLDLFYSNDGQFSTSSGIVVLPEGPMLVSFAPITDSEFRTTSSGILVFGKYLDENLLSHIEQIVQAELHLESADSQRLSRLGTALGKPEIAGHLTAGESFNHPVDDNTLEIYFYITSLDGQSNLLAKLTTNRTIYTSGVQSFNFFLLVAISFILAITILSLYLLQRYLVKPMLELSSTIERIDLSSNRFSRLEVKSTDELGRLSNEINSMLERMEQDNVRIVGNERKLMQVFEASEAGFFDMNLLDHTLYLSTNLYAMLEYPPHDGYVSIDFWKDLMFPEDLENISKMFRNVPKYYSELQNAEFRICSRSGIFKWFMIRSSIAEYDQDGSPKRITGIIIGIDEKKKIEEDLKYLSFHDKLTGIYNRSYFEYVLNNRINAADMPLSIIIGDLNGLKVINDAFGHAEGDNLLITVANVLVKSCRQQDVACRWGGDEFALILKNADEALAEAVCDKIRYEMDRIGDQYISLNISLGYSTRHQLEQDKAAIIREAEERMYRNKLFDDSSVRNSILASLKRALYEKSFETEEHTERMYDKCKKIGIRLNMSNAKIDELSLLAVLHDIGKVAISDSILNKPGPLTAEEWEIMKTHSEIGYRIANSSPEISHIAYPILCHHERYDGKGYPRGIKEKEIPTLSRIISIVDAFDVMTHDRPYRQRITAVEAIRELNACSGAHFDPELLKVCIEVFEEDLAIEEGLPA